ncbi:MAG: TonB-dependent receptor [Panacibacter sp.]
MRKIITTLLIQIFISVQLFAQTPQTLISGKVTDGKSKPVEAATISLMKATDSSLFKIPVTDKDGIFSFRDVPFGSYYINASAINYAKRNSTLVELSSTSLTKNMGAIVLQEETKSIVAVTVTAKKPLIEQKIDRMVVNVDASVTNVGSTALEVLEKSPGVSVDKDGNISLKGKSAVMLMIDGKPSYLSGAELANLLSNMNSNQLSQIEIMTNPSAKYDAAGNAGVINIKTKKSITQGFNGSVTLNYGQGAYPKLNNSIMLNYRTAKFNTFLNYGYILNRSFVNVDVTRNFLDANGNKSYELDQMSQVVNQSQNNNLKFGLDYYINPKTTVGFAATGFVAPQNGNAFTTAYIKDAGGTINSIEQTTKTTDNTWKNGTLNLNFHTSFDDDKKEVTGNFDYLHYDFAGNQNVNGSTFDANDQLLAGYYLKNILPLNIDVYSGKIDYAQSLSNGLKIETGIKSSLVKTSNTSLFYSKENDVQKLQDSLSNAFNYNENINAAYINLNKKFGDWTLQAGLRAENTNYKGNETSYITQQDSSFSRSYIGLFPTAFVGYQLNENNQFAISVGRRIDRPAYQQLNPFISYVDKYMRMAGNPYLQPQTSTNIELSHTYKNMFTTTLNYSMIHNMMNETMTQNDSLITRSVGNIGTRYNFGIAESATIPFTKWYTGIFFANLYENKYDGEVNGFPLNAQQLTLELNINNQFSFKNGWAAELSGTYATKNRDEGQAISLPIVQVSAAISKSLLNNKASLKFNIRDMFYTQKINEIQNFQDVQSTLHIARDTRVFNLAFVYRFGVQSKSKTSQATDEQKRIQVN